MKEFTLDNLGIYKQFVESADVLFFAVDKDMHYIYINPFFEMVHNITLKDAIGKHFRDVIGNDGFNNNVHRYNKVLKGEVIKYNSFFPKMDGNLHHYNAIYTPIEKEGKVVGFTGVVVDITAEIESQKQKEEIKHQYALLDEKYKIIETMSITDVLTKTYNREFYNEKISELISLHKRYKTPFSIIMYDIDNFKHINDTYGHIMGDKVLKEMSKLIKTLLRSSDYLFRVGGEEFIVLLSETTMEESKSVAEKIRKNVSELNTLNTQQITISLGLTEIQPTDTEKSLYKRVDNLMYDSKNNGKNRVTTGS
ncbi:diguanylate cyclase [Sulfurimonas sp.]